MESHSELISAKYLNQSLESADTVDSTPAASAEPAVRSTASQVLGGAKWFLAFVLGAAIYVTVANSAGDEANKSTAVADWFLWVSGSDKTWEEYQKEQIAKGNPRLKDKDLGWVGQLLQDAYVGN